MEIVSGGINDFGAAVEKVRNILCAEQLQQGSPAPGRVAAVTDTTHQLLEQILQRLDRLEGASRTERGSSTGEAVLEPLELHATLAGGVGGSRESFGPQWRDRDMYESPPSAAYRGGDGDRGHGGCAPSSEPGDITADLLELELLEEEEYDHQPSAVDRQALARPAAAAPSEPAAQLREPLQPGDRSSSTRDWVEQSSQYGQLCLHYDADISAATNVTAVISKLPAALALKWGEHSVHNGLVRPTLPDLDSWLRGYVAAGHTGADQPTDRGAIQDDPPENRPLTVEHSESTDVPTAVLSNGHDRN
ncbi:hypothetical protein FJT64_004095 [Amphibalanus amphitrite]|uniref:Uncharacterized protein n=1 Tax=Amphibalanus amphitrite TaxID=1232801 RepID=A0A6A4VZZ1_AMPAM|nr:hypothetical protein FJT64_004095 [Amphibalanus amphitrite]